MEEMGVKEIVRQRVHALASQLEWQHLSFDQRKQHYEIWSSDPSIGGLLREVMPDNRIRVYLKDTIMKNYSRSLRPTIRSLLSSMSLCCGNTTQEYTKPQGILCDGSYLYTLTTAKDWKTALLSAFERGSEIRELKRNLVLITEHTTGRFIDKSYRSFIDSAARRLDVEVHWIT